MMLVESSLDVSGYRDRAVPNTLYRQECKANHLAIVFPGYGYQASMPALYYPVRLMLARDFDVFQVDYAYNRCADFRTSPPDEQMRWFQTDVERACDAALSQRAYRQVTLVGKSIGTRAMGHLLSADAALREVRTQCIWLTPLLREERLRAQIVEGGRRSLFVIGTADQHYAPGYLRQVQEATGGQTVVIDGANHSLEIEGDVAGSLRAMERVVRAIAQFLD
jgi:hypothetical protein